MIQPGTYTAKVLSHSISTTKSGNPQVVVTFGVGTNKITYYGSFSEKAREYTIKNLITCGLKGNNPAGALDLTKEVEIVVENELDENGKERTKVRFINSVGQVRNAMPQAEAMAKLADLEGYVVSARQKLNKTDDDGIPF